MKTIKIYIAIEKNEDDVPLKDGLYIATSSAMLERDLKQVMWDAYIEGGDDPPRWVKESTTWEQYKAWLIKNGDLYCGEWEVEIDESKIAVERAGV